MSKFKVGDRVVRTGGPQTDIPVGAVFEVLSSCDTMIEFKDLKGDWRFRDDLENFRLAEKAKAPPLTKEQKAIAKAEANLAALKERTALKAKQAADRKAKAERAEALRGLSAAGKRVAAMLQAGSADDFGCQRENVIKLVAAITGDKPDAIKRAVAH